ALFPSIIMANDFYITSQAGNQLSVFDSENRDIKSSFDVSAGPVMLVIDKSDNAIYVSHPEQGKISVIDLNSHELINEIKTGGQPFSMVLDEQKPQMFV